MLIDSVLLKQVQASIMNLPMGLAFLMAFEVNANYPVALKKSPENS